MNVTRLSRLIAAFGQAATPAETKPTSSPADEVANGEAQANSEAVSFSPSLVTSSGADDRGARVAALKNQVQNGTYNPDSTQVAEAVARDLFA